MKCVICEIRKARRHCPGVQGDICTLCCGNEREVTINCPLSCPYLREARLHEKLVPWDPATAPNKEIDVPEYFLRQHNDLMLYFGVGLFAGVADSGGAVDSDVREALDSLTSTYRSLTKGLVYESLPVNPFAATVHQSMRKYIQNYQAQLKEHSKAELADATTLAILVVYQRIALTNNNGRPKGRVFISFLGQQFKEIAEQQQKISTESESKPLIEL